MKNLLLNTLLGMTLIFGFTNCEKDKNDQQDRAQWANCEGHWSDEALDCTGDKSCCLAEVVVKPSSIADDLITNGGGLDGITTLLEIAKSDEAKALFKSLNKEQMALLLTGQYAITPLVLEPELYQTQKLGRVKFFVGKKSFFGVIGGQPVEYDFNFGIDIRE